METIMNPSVDAYVERSTKWQDEVKAMRRIALATGLTEGLKWGQPCYTLANANIVIIQEFKDYCGILFTKGALLKDPRGILVPPGYSQSARQIRFTSVDEITELEPAITAYIAEAVEIEKAGLKVKTRETSEFEVPEEFQTRLDADPALKAAFEALTPGRQRAYLYHFAAPKQSSTRASRAEKAIPQILAGKGLND